MQTSPSKLYVILIILIGLIGGYIVYSQWVKPAEALIPPSALTNKDSLAAFKDLKIDFSVIDGVISKGLIISGESPVNPGVTGKKDIFAP